MNTFEDLKCWQLAQDLQQKVRKTVTLFPAEEKFRLTDQLIRCSRSVTNNIAEGFGRFHYLENAKFCRISRGSLYEVLDHLLIANNENYITNEQLKSYRESIMECLAVLNGYINYLTKMHKTEPKQKSSIL